MNQIKYFRNKFTAAKILFLIIGIVYISVIVNVQNMKEMKLINISSIQDLRIEQVEDIYGIPDCIGHPSPNIFEYSYFFLINNYSVGLTFEKGKYVGYSRFLTSDKTCNMKPDVEIYYKGEISYPILDSGEIYIYVNMWKDKCAIKSYSLDSNLYVQSTTNLFKNENVKMKSISKKYKLRQLLDSLGVDTMKSIRKEIELSTDGVIMSVFTNRNGIENNFNFMIDDWWDTRYMKIQESVMDICNSNN